MNPDVATGSSGFYYVLKAKLTGDLLVVYEREAKVRLFMRLRENVVTTPFVSYGKRYKRRFGVLIGYTIRIIYPSLWIFYLRCHYYVMMLFEMRQYCFVCE